MERRHDPPVIYEVLDDGKVVLESWIGKVDRQDVVSHARRHLSDSRIAVGASALVDAREASVGIAPAEVQAIVDGFYANDIGRMKIGKCALLVNDRTYEVARAYERSVGKYGINVIVFNALDVACEWLGLDPSVVLKHMDRAREVRAQTPTGVRGIGRRQRQTT